MLTLGNMLCGFAAVYFCILGVIGAVTNVDPGVKATLNNRFLEHFLPTFFSVGGFFIFLGMFFDLMDGRVARMTTGTTNFGGQLDSLADMVTFGVAPAILTIGMLSVGTREGIATMLGWSRLSWVSGAVYASCCALRLARFNVEHAEGDLRHTSFHGLPSPGAAAVVASLIILYEHVAEVRSHVLLNSLPFVSMAVGALMVSRVRYVHVPNVYLRGRAPFGYVLLFVITAALLIRFPAQTVAVVAGLYALSGPAWAVIGWFRRPQEQPDERPDSMSKGRAGRRGTQGEPPDDSKSSRWLA